MNGWHLKIHGTLSSAVCVQPFILVFLRFYSLSPSSSSKSYPHLCVEHAFSPPSLVVYILIYLRLVYSVVLCGFPNWHKCHSVRKLEQWFSSIFFFFTSKTIAICKSMSFYLIVPQYFITSTGPISLSRPLLMNINLPPNFLLLPMTPIDISIYVFSSLLYFFWGYMN